MVSFLFVLPIALPGIITGMALNSYFTYWGQTFGLWTIVVGHATFCIVIVYNNVVARLRRMPGSLTEASMDLGADGFQTFLLRDAAGDLDRADLGALLAFALSFDEVIVTTFTAGVAEHAADLDLREHPPRPAAARGERRRLPDPARDDHPGRARAAPDPRVWDPSHRVERRCDMATATRNKIFVGGKWTDAAEGGTMEVLNPATGETIAQVPACTAADVDAAVEAAKQALPGVARLDPGRARRAAAEAGRRPRRRTPRSSPRSSRGTSASRSSYARDEMPVCVRQPALLRRRRADPRGPSRPASTCAATRR